MHRKDTFLFYWNDRSLSFNPAKRKHAPVGLRRSLAGIYIGHGDATVPKDANGRPDYSKAQAKPEAVAKVQKELKELKSNVVFVSCFAESYNKAVPEKYRFDATIVNKGIKTPSVAAMAYREYNIVNAWLNTQPKGQKTEINLYFAAMYPRDMKADEAFDPKGKLRFGNWDLPGHGVQVPPPK